MAVRKPTRKICSLTGSMNSRLRPLLKPLFLTNKIRVIRWTRRFQPIKYELCITYPWGESTQSVPAQRPFFGVSLLSSGLFVRPCSFLLGGAFLNWLTRFVYQWYKLYWHLINLLTMPRRRCDQGVQLWSRACACCLWFVAFRVATTFKNFLNASSHCTSKARRRLPNLIVVVSCR